MKHFETLLNTNDITPFLIRQKTAATIALMGPTSSAKSTLITELLPPESNKLLSRNIGNTAQTTLIPTRLMLNSDFHGDHVLVTVTTKQNRSGFPDFWESLVSVMTEYVYDNRDEIEDNITEKSEFALDFEIAKQVLDPVNRAFHVYKFADDKNLILDFLTIMEEMVRYVCWMPQLICDEADKLYRQLRKSKSTAKKREAYEQIIETRMGQMGNKKLADWYDKLESEILNSLDHLWAGGPETKHNRIFFANLNPDEAFEKEYPDFIFDWSRPKTANELISLLYDKDSPYSLVFDEIIYATRPSDSFVEVFSKDYPDRTVKINVLDTVGLTQSSQDAEDISLNMDDIVSRESDALLFLCGADEQPLVYETCIKLLREKKNQLKQKVVVVCRTKADIVVRNFMRNAWKLDHGTNKIEKDKYGEYVVKAINAYISDQIAEPSEGEATLGYEENSPVKFISLTPDSTDDMDDFLKGELEASKVFQILFDIVRRVDRMYKRDDTLWLKSTDISNYPVRVAFSGEHLTKTIAMALVTSNSRNGNQYTQYIDMKGISGLPIQYHGRSVNCFRKKLSYGEGHETYAGHFGNFRLFITAMVRRWLVDVIPKTELLTDFSVDTHYLDTPLTEARIAQLEDDFISSLRNNWENILTRCAKALSYDFLRTEFEFCYAVGDSWSDAFRKSLRVLSMKFSDENYWEEYLFKCFGKYSSELLHKLYIFD